MSYTCLLYLYSQNYIFSGATLKTVYNTASNLKMFGEKFAWFALTKVRRLRNNFFNFQGHCFVKKSTRFKISGTNPEV